MITNDLNATLENAIRILKDKQSTIGRWEGQLSDSALATAVAVFALSQADKTRHTQQISAGLNWLTLNANDDGGWGDTPESISNISTTTLCLAAFSAGSQTDYAGTLKKAEEWLIKQTGSLEPLALSNAITDHYGSDRTFSAPILTMCALSGRLGPANEAWQHVAELPFELSIFPRCLFKWLNLSVVSYALPALITIGLARFLNGPECNALKFILRKLSTGRALKVLKQIQPESGGFLEATPLTGFVVMSLAASNLNSHPVLRDGVNFITASMRDNGAWPIDTNLSLWTTTLAVNALPADNEITGEETAKWITDNQFKTIHKYTGAEPGGWGWTDRSGAVPDADDTAGALLALRTLGAGHSIAEDGIQWLINLQNSDGGIPTFCKGWGKLPFDKSCPDITAHVMRAIDVWYDYLPSRLQSLANDCMHNGFCYLEKTQARDGSWSPLWFGSQATASHANPTYGTALVMIALTKIAPDRLPKRDNVLTTAYQWLISAQNTDGGWGGAKGAPSSIEETALATRAATAAGEMETAKAGVKWLIEHTDKGTSFPASPIGLYFASLWYDEMLYPIIFTIAALNDFSEKS